MAMVRKLGAHETRKLYRGLGLSGNAPGNYKGLYDPIIDALGLRPDYEALYAQEKEKFTCKTDLSSARGVSVAFLRFMCEKNEIATVKEEEGDGGGGAVQVQIKRAELEVKLAAKLGLPMKRPRKQKEFNEKVKMNLHRLNQLLFYMLFRWDGEKWGGSSIRSEVIELCKAKYMNDDGGLSDEEAVKKACAASSYFAGLWVFFDVEVRMCVEPFIDWEGGDITQFLATFPVMCAYVSSSHKTKVPKVFLMLIERLKQLKDNHKNAVKLFAANCSLFDEEKVEFMNAKLGRWIKARVKDLGIHHYKRTSSIMKGVQEIDESFSKMFNRKESESENARLRKMYTKASWAETHEALRKHIIEKFTSCMDGSKDAQWPRETFLVDGLTRIETKFLPELRKWIAQQQALEVDDDDDDNDDDDDDDDEAIMAAEDL